MIEKNTTRLLGQPNTLSTEHCCFLPYFFSMKYIYFSVGHWLRYRPEHHKKCEKIRLVHHSRSESRWLRVQSHFGPTMA
ncbi:hypothetical protein GCK32_019418 [Trichostrongylus colubriformis]|uniref:Uncharacterized protein n=1 Tax=Trichostrongylus colubriformis TaxID=6319 RepID=A0AAN8IIB4_TRICO